MTKQRSFLTLVTAIAVGITIGQANAQKIEVDVKKIEVDIQKTPDFRAGNVKDKSWKPKDWLEIEIEFTCKKERSRTAQGNQDYIDNLTFRYYVVLEKGPGQQTTEVLTHDVIHVNIPANKNEKVYSAIYIAPSAISKRTGKDNYTKSIVKGVAVVVSTQGVMVGGDSEGPSGKWWETMPKAPGFLLSKSQTPFQLLWFDRYAEKSLKTADSKFS